MCIYRHVCVPGCFSRVSLRSYRLQSTMLLCPWGFSRQGYWSRLSCPPPLDLPDPGMEPRSLTSPALASGFFTTCVTWEAQSLCVCTYIYMCVCVCVCVHIYIYIIFHIIFHYDLSQDIACSSPCYVVQRLCYLSVIHIQKGPLGLSVLCSWFKPMKQLNVPLHSLYFSMFGKVMCSCEEWTEGIVNLNLSFRDVYCFSRAINVWVLP